MSLRHTTAHENRRASGRYLPTPAFETILHEERLEISKGNTPSSQQ